jgi:hypothetical protein
MLKKPWNDPPGIRDVFYRLAHHPGYALNMVRQGKLGHLMYVSSESGSGEETKGDLEVDILDGPNSIFDHAEYTYLVDFTTRQLLFMNCECDEEHWRFVPLPNSTNRKVVSDIWETLSQTKKVLSEEKRVLIEKNKVFSEERKAFLDKWHLLRDFKVLDRNKSAKTEKMIANGPDYGQY